MADFFAKKKKKGVKSMNLNKDETTEKKVEKKEEKTGKDDAQWVEEVPKEEPTTSPKGRVAGNIADIRAENETQKQARSWNAAPAEPTQQQQDTGKGAGKRGAYRPPGAAAFNAPGAVTDRKFPELEKTVATTNISVGDVSGKAKMDSSNAFARLAQMDESSDEEGGKTYKLAHMKKTKGANANSLLEGVRAKKAEEDITEEELQRMEKFVAEKKKKLASKAVEKEVEAKAREKKEQEELKKKVEKEKKEKEGIFLADSSKFEYGRFDISACQDKYDFEKNPEMEQKRMPYVEDLAMSKSIAAN